MTEPGAGTLQLGEFALRVNDLDRMATFYLEVVGLRMLTRSEGAVFLQVSAGVPGHPQLLVLFDRGITVSPEHSTVDHFAFIIPLDQYEHQHRRLSGLGVAVRRKEFQDFHWRSLFFADPDGNTIEFVCYDPDV